MVDSNNRINRIRRQPVLNGSPSMNHSDKGSRASLGGNSVKSSGYGRPNDNEKKYNRVYTPGGGSRRGAHQHTDSNGSRIRQEGAVTGHI